MKTQPCKQVTELQEKFVTIERYLNALSQPLPDWMAISIGGPPTICGWVDEQADRLIQIGELFGTLGWSEVPDGFKYNWTKEVDGVRLTFWNIKPRPIEQPRPVNPNEFPLQLT